MMAGLFKGMPRGEFEEIAGFEDALRAGDACRVRWTYCYRQYESIGVVDRVHLKSIAVELRQDVRGLSGKIAYCRGCLIKAPRLATGTKWSTNNRVLPPRTES